MTTDAQTSGLPPNARIETLTFDDRAGLLRVSLRGSDETLDVPATSVVALIGARIRHDTVTSTADRGGISFGKLAVTLSTGIPVGIKKGGPKEKAIVGQELHHALGLRTAGVAQVWYLLAASFNYRKALLESATYSSEMNLRLFIKRLADFAPQAARDEYFTAMLAKSSLPPPLDSLLEFFRTASG